MGSAVATPRASDALSPELSSQPIVFGASGGSEVSKLSQKIGAPLGMHVYGKLSGSVISGRLITMEPNGNWKSVTSAGPGSSIYNDLVRWADTIKGRSGGPFLFTFSHEPEGSSAEGLGTSADFIAAWRKVHDVFVSRGVRNVEWTWNLTSNAFRVPASDRRYAAKWYPGDAYVDNVATAAYNWYNCGEGHGQWLSLASRAAEPLAFAKSHNKQYVLAEWASQQDSRRAQWLRDARTWFLANKAWIRGAFYYQSPTPRAGCSWKLTSDADLDAFGDMARDRANFGG